MDGRATEGSEGPSTPTRRKRAASRRTRGAQFRHSEETHLPPKAPPDAAEKARLETLQELTNAEGGVKTEGMALTAVMVMHEERRPRIHEGLLEMVMRSSNAILEAFMKTKQFLPALYNWMNIYSKEGSEEWREVLIKIVRVFGRLPMTKDGVRELRIRLRKLTQTVDSKDVKEAVDQVLEEWDEKRRGDEKREMERKSNTMSRLNSWNKRKAGKAFVGTDPDVKCRKTKLTRKFSNPLSARDAASRCSARSMATSNSETSSPLQVSSQRRLDFDALPPEATKAIDKLKMAQLLKKHQYTAPSQLIHSMQSPPRDAVFYAQQTALYHELKNDNKHVDLGSEGGNQMCSEVEWDAPKALQLPVGEVKRAPMDSTEESAQKEREQSVAATDSGILFSSLQEMHPTVPAKTAWTAAIPFFPNNPSAFGSQQGVMMDAGVTLPSLLGVAKSDEALSSPMGPLTSAHSPPISDASNLTESQKH